MTALRRTTLITAGSGLRCSGLRCQALGHRCQALGDSHSTGSAIGGDNNELHYFYGFEDFAEIDAWPSKQEVLTAAIGEEDAARLLAALEAVSEKTTSLWQLEAELSQLGGE